MASSGMDVILADLALRRPKRATGFGLEGSVGVTQAMLGHSSLDEGLSGSGGSRVVADSKERLRQGSLQRLTAGPTPPSVVLERQVAARGTARGHILCDNGPELTANALRDWCRFTRAGSAYIEPGSPWQNAFVESFGSRVRDELLAVELFESLTEAQVLVADWREDYHHGRQHSSLGMTAPASVARAWAQSSENRQPTTRREPRQAPRSPHDEPTAGPHARIGPDHGGEGDQVALAKRAEPTTLPPQTDDRLSHWVDR